MVDCVINHRRILGDEFLLDLLSLSYDSLFECLDQFCNCLCL